MDVGEQCVVRDGETQRLVWSVLDWDSQQKVGNKDANSISILTGINGNSLQMHLYITIGRALVQYLSITITLQTVMDWNGTGHLPLIVLLSTLLA